MRLTSLAPPLSNLLLGDVLLILSDMVGYVTLPWWIIHRGGARDLAVYSAAIAIATLIATPLIAPLGDRYAKRAQIVWGTLASMAIAFCLALLASRNDYRLHLIVAIGVLGVVASAFSDLARSTISAELIAPERLAEALLLRRSAQAVGRALGPAMAGVALSLGGVAAALWLNGALLGIAVWTVLRLPVLPVAAHAHTPGRGFARWRSDLRAGLRAKWSVPMERAWTLVNFIVWIFQGPAVGMLIPLKVQSLGLSGLWLGICEAALSAGLLLGSARGSDALVKRFGRFNVRVGVAMCEGLALAASGWAPSGVALVAALTAVGFANASMGLVGATHRTLAIPQDFRVRLLAATKMSTQVAGMLGPMLAGAALTRWSVGTVYMCFGLATCVFAFGFVFIPRSREFFSLNHEQVTDWFRREYPAVFGPAPDPHQRSNLGPSSVPASVGSAMPSTYQTPQNGTPISGQ